MYHDLWLKTQNLEGALAAIPPLAGRNMIGPIAATPADPETGAPAIGEPGWYYAAVRTKRDPVEILADLAQRGVVSATREEVEAVCGVWAA